MTAPASTTAPALDLRGVSVRYGEVTALDDVTLSIPTGSIYALVGMNGAGKSTLFGTIMGRVRPAVGKVQLFGGTPAAARRAGRVAFMPQSDDIDRDFPVSVGDVVMMGRYGHLGFTRRPRPVDRERVADALDRVDLGALIDRPIGALSGGQRKRAFVARALAQEADLLLLDEPFAGVDVVSEELIADVLAQLAAQGSTVLVSTHDLATLPDRAEKVILLARRIITVDAPAVALAPETLAQAFGLPKGAAS